MGLVDGDQAEVDLGQALQHGAGGQAFGRDVEQVQFAGAGGAPDGRALLHRHAGIEAGGGHALLLQGLDLIGHQGDQRRHHQADAGAQDGRDLIADALAAAGRQHGHDVAPGQNLGHDMGLQTAEISMAPDPAQNLARGAQVQRSGGGGTAGVSEHRRVVPDPFGGVTARPSRKGGKRVWGAP
ncbi:hypothetical protein D3C72_1418360 [compost metagenome]